MTVDVDAFVGGEKLTVSLDGEICYAEVYELRPSLLTVIDGARSDVTINLAGVTFLDCAGLGLLVETWNHARTLGRAVTVAAPDSPTVAVVLSVLGPTLPFPIPAAAP
jgi:anti-anti-sigma factor